VTPLETLRALDAGEEAPAQAKARVRAALLASLEAAAVATAAGTLTHPKPIGTLPPVPPALVAGAVSSKTLTVALGIWLFGGVTGAALYGALRPQQVRVVYVDRPAAPLVLQSTPAPPSLIVSPSSPLLPGSAPARAASPSPVVTSALSASSELARERALLDPARKSMAQGEPALALQRTEQHRQQFPHGHLTEEREALGIRALLALGRANEARQRAQAFRVAYPNSFLLPAVELALAAPSQ